MSEQLIAAMANLDEEGVTRLVQESLDAAEDPMLVLADCRTGMSQVGQRYEAGEYYVSELIMAGEIFKQASARISSQFAADAGPKRGTVVVGTVKGDIHDIGKDIVVTLLEANNFEVIDLGVDVPAEKFVEAVKSSGAAVVGLSGLLTISFDAMKATVDALVAAGLRSGVKVMVGGGPVTEQVCGQVGADALGTDAQAAVSLCEQWI